MGVPIRNTADYSPFGVQLDGRTIQGDFYRRGFNGMEKDDEVKGGGNSYDFGARMYDSRVGRWLSCDALVHKYPDWTPYKYALNDPLNWIDLDGNQEFPTWADYKAWAIKNDQPVLSHKQMNSQGHWLEQDRIDYENEIGCYGGNTKNAIYYRMANYRNMLKNDASQYHDLPERRLFYAWAADYMSRKGHKVKWMDAAVTTVGKLEMGLWGIADFAGDSDYFIRKFIKAGNKLILDDMMPKVKELEDMNCPLGSKQSFMWDAQTLADEQNLIQPLYESLPKSSIGILQDNFNDMLGAKGNVLEPADRWTYGMKKMGYDVTPEMMPKPSSDWKDYTGKSEKKRKKSK